MGFVEHLDQGAARMDALDDMDTIEHRPGCPVPFGEHEYVTLAEGVDCFLQLGPVLGGLAAGFRAVDRVAALGAENTELSIQVLMRS